MKTFDSNRPLEILIIHSELVCQNDAIQKYKTRVRVPKRFKEFRYEKLYSVCCIITRKYFQFDSEFFEEYQN